FLLRYIQRPLHFFGSVGMMGVFSGSAIALWLAFLKLVNGANVMVMHGPLLFFAAVLIIAGVQFLALGLLGEMHVRHYHQAVRHASYSVDRVLRAKSEQQNLMAD